MASYAGVSQSLIAKIEGGKIDPSYKNVKRIFKALENEMGKQKRTILAREISNKEVVYVDKKDLVHRAIELMQKYDISQLPVYDKNTPVGSITEGLTTNYLAEKRDLKKLLEMRVGELMEEGFPHVSEDTPIEVITTLLQYSPAVLTTKKGMVAGIVTKANLLKILRGIT